MKRILLFKLLCTALISFSFAQQTVTGTVTDASTGEALIGVNILVKDTSIGTITEVDGSYKLEVPNADDAVLIFSFIGYERREVPVRNQSQIDLQLSTDMTALEEVVVVGYGTQKRGDVTGSIASVKGEELIKLPTASFENALQGLATGVQVTASSGVPGAPVSIKVRGVSSINAGTDPLYVVDGMPIYSGGDLAPTQNQTVKQSPLSMINPNDIESIEVLKDAGATAIYGSRGSNGVIIITTKKGKEGMGNFNISYSAGITDLVTSPEDVGFTNTNEWFDLVDRARINSNLGPFDPMNLGPLPTIPENSAYGYPKGTLTREEARQINTNWFDQILRKGKYQEVNISNSSAFGKGSLFWSVNYRDDESVLINNKFQRFSARSNLNFEPVKNLTSGLKLNLSHTINDRVLNGSGSNGGGFGNANRESLSWFPVYDENVPGGYWNSWSGYNLAAIVDEDNLRNDVKQYRALGGVFLDYNIPFVEGLSVRSEFSFDFIQNNTIIWTGNPLIGVDTLGNRAQDATRTWQSYNYNIYGTYNRTFGDHGLNVVFGTEAQRQWQEQASIEARQLIGVYQELGPNRPGIIDDVRAYLGDEEYFKAYFGRFNYNLKGKYLLGVSFRRDGISIFTDENRWGTFMAVSAGWMISDESFMSGMDFLSELKLRGSYGQTGNKNISRDAALTVYRNRTDWRYGSIDDITAGTRITNIGNQDITWETTNSFDIGFDYGLFDNRLSGSFAYYNQYVEDLLLETKLPTSTGGAGNNIWDNIGDLVNQGFEFSINAVTVVRKDFRWTTDLNFTTNRSEVKKLTQALDTTGGFLAKDGRIFRTGLPLRTFFFAEYAGVDPEKGVNMIYEIDVERYEETGETVKTGRKIPATLTNLATHRMFFDDKPSEPTYYGGINNSFSFRGFDLNFLVTFSGGNYILDYTMQRTTDVQRGQAVLRKDLIGNTWEEAGDDAKYPQLVWNGVYHWDWDPNIPNPEWDGDPEDPRATGYWVERSGNYNIETSFSTKYLFRGDYIRLRNVQLGYSFSNKVTEKLFVNNLRVYISGTNLLTYAPYYDSWDPETNPDQLPPLKIYSAGINVTF